MEDWLIRLERALTTPGAWSRRSFFGGLAKSAFAVVAALAGATIPVSASGCRQVACCCLAYPTNCSWCAAHLDCSSCSGGCWEWVCCTECGVGCPTCTIHNCNCSYCIYNSCHFYDCMECSNQSCSCASYSGRGIKSAAAGSGQNAA
jgi:hypothetical protein